MKIKRMTTSDRVNRLLSKEEPEFHGLVELEKIELASALNWYSTNRDKDASSRYLADHCKQFNIKASSFQISSQISTLGFVCRMLSRGAILDSASLSWFNKKLHDMVRVEPTVPEKKMGTIESKPSKETIQNSLKEKCGACIGHLEGAIDEFILSDFKKTPNTLDILRTHDPKGIHGPSIVNFFKKWRDEYRIAITEKDPVINEAYSNYTIVQMKKMEALYDQIISDSLKVMGEAVALKPVRKQKVKTPEQQIKSLKYCLEDTTLHIKSVPPIRIIGAECLWSYHIATRMLSCYVADDASGLGIKGCAILNYSKSKSRTKKLRKPEKILPLVVSEGKPGLRKIMDELTTKDAPVTGRLGKDIVLVRVNI